MSREDPLLQSERLKPVKCWVMNLCMLAVTRIHRMRTHLNCTNTIFGPILIELKPKQQ